MKPLKAISRRPLQAALVAEESERAGLQMLASGIKEYGIDAIL